MNMNLTSLPSLITEGKNKLLYITLLLPGMLVYFLYFLNGSLLLTESQRVEDVGCTKLRRLAQG